MMPPHSIAPSSPYMTADCPGATPKRSHDALTTPFSNVTGPIGFPVERIFTKPVTGSAEIISGEIAEDLTNYLAVSEQTPSSVGLGVLIGTDLKCIAAGGFIIQPLPNASDKTISKIEENLSKIDPVSTMVENGFDAEKIITSAEVMFDTINDDTKTKSDAILARMTITGNITTGKDTSINDQAIKLSEWARDLNEETTYRNVTLTVKTSTTNVFRIYQIPDMFVCDYKESFKSSDTNDAYAFELKLTQSENKLKFQKPF